MRHPVPEASKDYIYLYLFIIVLWAQAVQEGKNPLTKIYGEKSFCSLAYATPQKGKKSLENGEKNIIAEATLKKKLGGSATPWFRASATLIIIITTSGLGISWGCLY